MRASLLAAALLLSASGQAANASYGEHGMALFGGKEGLYLSHLPMFHAPHDYQVVLQVHVANPKVDMALRRRLEGKPALWTIAPEKFELDRLSPQAAQPLKRFKADLVLGHFEQKGVTQHHAATLVVDRVLMYRQLSAEPHDSATATYTQIGQSRRRFLVKQIDSRPDFDHIVAYRAKADAPVTAISVAKDALKETDAATLARALHTVPSDILGTVYFYTDDLR
ncbi:hypothetical protein HSX11_20725 [Oxalobacteraceae bacterium]|nr:hypothetical protein [Oxalobacteraceae bacterium]